jgi:hypothetical protein
MTLQRYHKSIKRQVQSSCDGRKSRRKAEAKTEEKK